MEKKCKECNEIKSITGFYANSKCADGYLNQCIDCVKAARKAKEYKVIEEDKKCVERYHSSPKYRMRRNFYEQARRESQPHWALTYKDEWDEVYNTRLELQETTGLKHHIDHIIPVIHSDVCGLSVPWNYQVLSQSDNIRKSNKFDGTYENESWRNDL